MLYWIKKPESNEASLYPVDAEEPIPAALRALLGISRFATTELTFVNSTAVKNADAYDLDGFDLSWYQQLAIVDLHELLWLTVASRIGVDLASVRHYKAFDQRWQHVAFTAVSGLAGYAKLGKRPSEIAFAKQQLSPIVAEIANASPAIDKRIATPIYALNNLLHLSPSIAANYLIGEAEQDTVAIDAFERVAYDMAAKDNLGLL